MKFKKKLTVVWVTHFSDEELRNHLEFASLYYRYILSRLLKKPLLLNHDFAPWVRNGIKEFERYDDINLTVVFPHFGVKKKIQKFSSKGVQYICFRSEDDNLMSYALNNINKQYHPNYKKNRRIISELIKDIHPDIVHYIGAENPYYSLSALDVPADIPCMVSLQTLMTTPCYEKNYPINKELYDFRSKVEVDVINRCDYIACGVENILEGVRHRIKPLAKVLKLTLAVGVTIDTSFDKKEFDFVYFAPYISKAADIAIEAFAIACKKHPGLSLNISGDYTNDFKRSLDLRIMELGIEKNVVYSGSKASQKEVIEQIKKSRFALLPLKVDVISSTIREAMACGLPVVSTITDGTPKLNGKRQSILLSPIQDYEAMAMNMLKLVEDVDFASTIRDNAIQTVRENYSNEIFMEQWRKAYHSIADSKY